jgi:type II secretory pathway component GspD/PulD (secretin)
MTISTVIFVTLLSAQQVSVDAREMELSDFIRLIGKTAGMNVVIHPEAQGKVNLMVTDASWDQVLDMVLKNHGLAKEISGNTIRIVPARLQTRVYFLNYARAEDIARMLATMISPQGSVVAYPPLNAVIVRDIDPIDIPHR